MRFMEFLSKTEPLRLPRLLAGRLDRASQALLLSGGGPYAGFSKPEGEPSFTEPGSVSWQIFKNPVCVFIGGVTAVILELAEPSVRTGVWQRGGFRSDPVRRLKRTGLAAMVTVYAAQSTAAAMIAGVRRMHEKVCGTTPSGRPYSANDPELLNWVHGTAAFGFSEAYSVYAEPLSEATRSRYFTETAAAARHYGVTATASSVNELMKQLEAKRGGLERSPIVFEFLDIMRTAKIFPAWFRPAQLLFIRAAISIVPAWIREILGLTEDLCLTGWQEAAIKHAARVANRIVLPSSPPVQACLRMELPADYLYRR
jgi:uncharacterized protein (DUF2236 family)